MVTRALGVRARDLAVAVATIVPFRARSWTMWRTLTHFAIFPGFQRTVMERPVRLDLGALTRLGLGMGASSMMLTPVIADVLAPLAERTSHW